MTPRQLRVSRAAAASSVATFIAAVSHTLGGGVLPHPLLVLAVAVFLIPLAALLVGARQSVARIALTVGVSQLAFHLLFHLTGGVGASPGLSGHHHHTVDLAGVATTTAVAPSAGMLLAHTAAALVTTLLVWRGEALLRWIASWALALLQRTRIVLASPVSAPVFVRTLSRVFRARFLSGPVLRRGPPLLSCG